MTIEASKKERTFLVECYSPGIDRAGVEAEADRARGASAELRDSGVGVDYVGAVLVPQDEVVFHLFRSPDAAIVRDVFARAGLAFERVVESVVLEMA
ncbi:MAG: hypothetical protein H0T59_01270 [Chloroflexi bacterium]|nr:hypothetical protein [Chloroflexota bacterium]